MKHLMEPTMDRTRVRRVVGRAIAEAAAARAVDDVIIAMIGAGLPPEQAKGIAYAAQQFLVDEPGHEDRARDALQAAGFRNGQAQAILNLITETFSAQSNAA